VYISYGLLEKLDDQKPVNSFSKRTLGIMPISARGIQVLALLFKAKMRKQ
jgi:hypothetical protein